MTDTDEGNDESDDTLSHTPEAFTVEKLLERCRTLLSEIGQFEAYVKQRGKEKALDLRAFRTALQAELKFLQKKDVTIQNLRSSNLSFYVAVWDAAKSSCGVVALNKRFSLKGDKNTTGTERITVDIVAEGGAEWAKVSTVTEMKLIFEMTKNGWDFGSNDTEGMVDGDDDDTALHLQKLARDLQGAAAGVRIRYRHPKIRFVLPKIEFGATREIDHLITTLRSTGVIVQCANDIIASSPLGETIPRMVYDEFASFTPTLNIDCTLLLALVSDLSHGPVSIQPSHPLAIRRQIEREETDQLLPTNLWPAMIARELVCTSHAARRMREIVDLIGTPGEKARTALLMGDDEGPCQSLIDGFQKYSTHPVPKDWQIPVKVMQEDKLDSLQTLPSVANIVREKLSDINRSVFLYGWAKGITTLSSNRTVVKMVERVMEESGSDVGPDIWLCPTARSLLGKEKKIKGGGAYR